MSFLRYNFVIILWDINTTSSTAKVMSTQSDNHIILWDINTTSSTAEVMSTQSYFSVFFLFTELQNLACL
jgi:hypothetical protein